MDFSALKSPGIENLDKDGILVIIPLGSIEAHGLHLPLGTDSIIVEHLAQKASAGLDNVLVAPTVTYSYNLINYDYPGTVSIQPENFAHYLADIIKSFHHHGFRNFFLLSSHGGNEVPVKLAINNLLFSSYHSDCDDVTITHSCKEGDRENLKIAFKTWWKLAKVRSKHAERNETSLMLKIAPDLVDMSKAVDCDPQNPWHWYSSRKKYYPETYGVNGEPTKANMKDAEVLYKKVVNGVREYVSGIIKQIDSPSDRGG